MSSPGPDIAGSVVRSRPVLRFLTCGSVDDGKSTLIGRLLYEQNLIFDDHLAALTRDSRKHGTTGADIDFALLLDGLEAEREQGITIDVAYRYFATPRRAFIVADTPGHEQYTRNMATGASNSDLAILLVDARKGLLAQTRRHAIIAGMLGIRHVVLAVNKIDLVGFSQDVFDGIAGAFAAFAAPLGFKVVQAIPLSARYGDNLSVRSDKTPWFDGPSLLEFLETVDVEDDRAAKAFRLPVQWVNRPNLDFRGFAGTVASGTIGIGEEIAVLPSGRSSVIKSILSPAGEVDRAEAGDAVTVTLADEIDIARGDVMAPMRERPQVADQFAAHLVWMSAERLLPGRSYLMKINHGAVVATVTELKHRVDTDSLAKLAAKTLALNEVGVCNLSTGRPIVFDTYADNRTTGAFILIDRVSNETVAAGMVDFPLRRATNIHRQNITVTKEKRSLLNNHRPAVLWFTGLSGAGKSTIANLVEVQLHARGVHTLLLDGDNVRHGLNRDLGFTEADRVENIRRIGEVAKLMTEAGLVVLCSFISPFRAERQMARELVADGEFLEIFVDAPLEQCVARDPKGLYRRALAGEIKNFTGVDQPYEVPQSPDLHLKSGEFTATELAEQVVRGLERLKVI
ncbi:sulfate adenylyltransferase subunit CysN [Pseudolabrys sp. FHR47]|uniref:sulfate adenylyltransferase subunit CysN n=1 Tax=Pseudolabrys sp. FHR47 TaxID=2562284 RepID=UPI0010BF093A|nr:sulfate adenylyltransferase subunit CysN [Pseudolabrys sp. FHR47]